MNKQLQRGQIWATRSANKCCMHFKKNYLRIRFTSKSIQRPNCVSDVAIFQVIFQNEDVTITILDARLRATNKNMKLLSHFSAPKILLHNSFKLKYTLIKSEDQFKL